MYLGFNLVGSWGGSLSSPRHAGADPIINVACLALYYTSACLSRWSIYSTRHVEGYTCRIGLLLHCQLYKHACNGFHHRKVCGQVICYQLGLMSLLRGINIIHVASIDQIYVDFYETEGNCALYTVQFTLHFL